MQLFTYYIDVICLLFNSRKDIIDGSRCLLSQSNCLVSLMVTQKGFTYTYTETETVCQKWGGLGVHKVGGYLHSF